MNKSAIKGFSVRARRKLIEDISQKAYALGIRGTGKYDDIEEFEGGFRIKNAVNQIIYPLSAKKDREKLISEINRKGYEQVAEEVAYTWFNRIIAIRFMEINEYLPVKVRMLSSEVKGKTEPDVITHIYDYVSDLELDGEKVFNLKENHKDEELFKYVFVKECNNLGKLMPQVFEAISDYTELLLPDQLLSIGSVVRDLVESIDEEDFKEEVEIIGWMYQYYISEKKDEVFEALKKNKKITKENIPAATQLFTPKWIVKYMTENSLGRLWQESHPDETLKKKWAYYIEPTEQEPEVQKKLSILKNPNLSPEEIKILDPAMGSGHILVYAFDVLYDIYLSRGYAERDIPQLILEKNLYGLDIDDRAAQLASFALLMKARSKNRRFLKSSVELNVCSIQESNGFSIEALEYLANPDETQIEKVAHLTDARYLIDVFKDAKEFGSILEVKKIDYESLHERVEEIRQGLNLSMFEFGYRNEILEKIPQLVKQGRIISRKYNVVLANPPYMGRKGMNPKLSCYLDDFFQNSKNDLYTVFIERCRSFSEDKGFFSLINQQSWMFVKTFQNLRKEFFASNTIYSMLHLGARTFDEISGEVVQSTCYVVRKLDASKFSGTFMNLVDGNNSSKKEEIFLSELLDKTKQRTYHRNFDFFQLIPGLPISYWISKNATDHFKNGKFVGVNVDALVSGNKTADNEKFLRYHWECKSVESGDKWILYAKGGRYRKWFGNLENVIDWSDGAKNFYKKNSSSNLINEEYWFKAGISYTDLTSGDFNARILDENQLFDMSGPGIILANREKRNYILGLLNSKVGNYFLRIMNSSFHIKLNDISRVPYVRKDEEYCNVVNIVDQLIYLAKLDWDSSEISYEYKRHPIVDNKFKKDTDVVLRESVKKYLDMNNQNFHKYVKLEEDLNSKFIEIYSLGEELTKEIDYDNIPVFQKHERDIIVEYISYATGVIIGRYFDNDYMHDGEFQNNVCIITINNLLIITEDDYFENDILHRFVEFLKVTFSEETLEENLKYIAEVLNPKSKDTSRQTIRSYFVKDFYNDHVKMYKKKPIYWMIDSGKQNGIKALFYMHRYDKSTIARFRTDYLHEIQRYYENDIGLTERSNDKKKLDNLKKKLQEVTEFDKVVAHIAHQQIEFDLDDGVDHNYELFQGVEVPQGDGQKPMKADLLAKRK